MESLAHINECLRSCPDVNSKDFRGETALTYVKFLLRHGQFLLAFEAASLLLSRGADVDAEDYGHQTLLAHSLGYLDESADLTRLLLNHGAEVWHGTDFGRSRGTFQYPPVGRNRGTATYFCSKNR